MKYNPETDFVTAEFRIPQPGEMFLAGDAVVKQNDFDPDPGLRLIVVPRKRNLFDVLPSMKVHEVWCAGGKRFRRNENSEIEVWEPMDNAWVLQFIPGELAYLDDWEVEKISPEIYDRAGKVVTVPRGTSYVKTKIICKSMHVLRGGRVDSCEIFLDTNRIVVEEGGVFIDNIVHTPNLEAESLSPVVSFAPVDQTSHPVERVIKLEETVDRLSMFVNKLLDEMKELRNECQRNQR